MTWWSIFAGSSCAISISCTSSRRLLNIILFTLKKKNVLHESQWCFLLILNLFELHVMEVADTHTFHVISLSKARNGISMRPSQKIPQPYTRSAWKQNNPTSGQFISMHFFLSNLFLLSRRLSINAVKKKRESTKYCIKMFLTMPNISGAKSTMCQT